MAKKKLEFHMNQYSIGSPQSGEDAAAEVAAPTMPRKAAKRVENIPVLNVMPDEFQPRIQLPQIIAKDFFNFRIDCFEAMRRWIDMAQDNPIYARKLRGLYELGESVDAQGQIKPATGIWREAENGSNYFMLETGERRFWAIVLEAIQKKTPRDEVTISAISESEPNVERQAVENEKVEKLSAVARAREIARLLLSFYGIEPDRKVDNGFCGYHRRVKDYKFKSALYERVQKIMGLDRPAQTQYIQILMLPDAILEEADAFDLPKRELYKATRMDADERDSYLADLFQKIGSDMSEEDMEEFAPARPAVIEGVTVTGEPIQAQRQRRTRQDPSIQAARKIRAALVINYKQVAKTTGAKEAVNTIAQDLFKALEDEKEMKDVASRLETLAAQLRMHLNDSKK